MKKMKINDENEWVKVKRKKKLLASFSFFEI